MKIKLSELKPNPFKKQISKGKLNKEIVEKIKANIKELGLMGSLPVFKREGEYFLVAGHHRAQALKETFGKDYQVECTLHNYTDENVLRGMVIENLTQRSDELVEVTENLSAVRNWLKKNKMAVQQLNTHDSSGRKKSSQQIEEAGSIRNIYDWISKNGEVMAIGKISSFLKVHDNLDRRLLKKVIKVDGGITEEKKLSIEDAKNLARIEKKEQPLMERVIEETGLDHKNKGKLITLYLASPEEIRFQVRNGEINLADIRMELDRYKMEQARKEKGEIKVKSIKKNIDEQINYLKFSLSNSSSNIKQSIKYLIILGKYLKDMDEEQKERLDNELEKYQELYKKVSELISRVREKI